MESFDWPKDRLKTGKKLPGKHGQQDLSAALAGLAETPKHLTQLHFSKWHGFR
jgi:hypothetical protein